jgi:hypothetical protein
VETGEFPRAGGPEVDDLTEEETPIVRRGSDETDLLTPNAA